MSISPPPAATATATTAPPPPLLLLLLLLLVTTTTATATATANATATAISTATATATASAIATATATVAATATTSTATATTTTYNKNNNNGTMKEIIQMNIIALRTQLAGGRPLRFRAPWTVSPEKCGVSMMLCAFTKHATIFGSLWLQYSILPKGFYTAVLPVREKTIGVIAIVWFQKISIPPPRREFHLGPPSSPDFPVFEVSYNPPSLRILHSLSNTPPTPLENFFQEGRVLKMKQLIQI